MSSLSPKQAAVALAGTIFAAYIAFQAQDLILGPRISIAAPMDGAVVYEPAITLSGRARNAAWITLNGNQIFTDEEGRFSEKLLASPGFSIMTVRVRDRFGREAEKSIRIIFNND